MTPTQPDLLREEAPNYATDGPITCLGITFPDETARRAYFSERLREHLQDPDFRATEGFPIGTDEDILALSDPPYYTACPNPFLPEIIADWTVGRTVSPTPVGRIGNPTSVGRIGNPTADSGRTTSPTYKREPFAADVSEGKNDPIYNAHSYHTKVPHKAIMRYILHYTEPGDIVFDGFCGTGMTGVAAQLCGDRAAVESLFPVSRTGSPTAAGRTTSPTYEDNPTGRTTSPTYKVGARRAILNDLSPAATFIAYNYNTPVDAAAFAREATRILAEVERELGWMYETLHTDGQTKGRINYTVWSEVFACPTCNAELVLWDIAVDPETRKVAKNFHCSECGTELTKNELERVQENYFYAPLGQVLARAKQVPVLIDYAVGKSRFEKQPDNFDLELVREIENNALDKWIPVRRIDEDIDLWYERDYRALGIYSIDMFYSRRNLLMLSWLQNRVRQVTDERLRSQLICWLQSVTMGFSKLNRFLSNAYSQVNRILSGTLYVGSFTSEVSPWYALKGKIGPIAGMSRAARVSTAAVTTSAAQTICIPDESLDYIFIDPPFGSNIIYSDLSIVWESWLRLSTDVGDEAVVHRRKKSGSKLVDYQEMMTNAFVRMYAALKPGRWMTVEFHNTQNAVWLAIQEGLSRAGFVVADVRTLDKGMGSFKQVTAQGSTKQDLIISAYKPTDDFQQRFLSHAGTAEGVWEFVRQHLAQVPAVVSDSHGQLETIAERQNFLLFDRMVAYHIQRGVAVPMGAAHFYAGLERSFVKRDGMYFLPDQVAAYDRARLEAAGVAQLVLFVSDEKSALHWLRQQLAEQPQSFQEIQPRFLRELHQARHEELPDLRVLLEENFLLDAAGRWYVPDPNRAEDLEKLRLRGLLREFETYKAGKKKLRQFRTEAMRAGFAAAWRAREYAVIVEVAERLPEQVLQEDEELVMYYDNARNRS